MPPLPSPPPAFSPEPQEHHVHRAGEMQQLLLVPLRLLRPPEPSPLALPPRTWTWKKLKLLLLVRQLRSRQRQPPRLSSKRM